MNHKPTIRADGPTFDDHGDITHSEAFNYLDVDEELYPELLAMRLAKERAEAARQQVIIRLLQVLAAGKANSKVAGQRVLLLNYLLQKSDCKNQRELSKRLGITPGRTSQALNSLRRQLPMIEGV